MQEQCIEWRKKKGSGLKFKNGCINVHDEQSDQPNVPTVELVDKINKQSSENL